MNRDKIWREELICKPLDNYNDVIHFLQHPPPWRTLCKPLTPHSKTMIRNMDIHGHYGITHLESPESYCHFNPDNDDVKRSDEKSLPKTLVCHDMANGYHDDSIIDGTGNANEYTFYNWAGIDIFCYFSHHFITIPPLGWINVGHDHGVKVIGTVITEWAEGVSLWDKILESTEEYETFATALVAIAQTLKFDGWLLNIENKVSRPETLLRFVQYLHNLLHGELEDPVLVWYDSVTVDGKLNWQNGLNEKNKAFFDACDALFTNYSWREEDVASSARAAGARRAALYVGIDVWGRNFFGGGQFNVQEAVKVAFSYGCSLAIFAPAWSHEAMDQGSEDLAVALAEDLSDWEVFLLRDRALWGSLWPFLNTRLPAQLPFQTSFCLGRGRKRRLYGEVLCPVPWFNLRHMQYQPNSAHGPHGYMLSTHEHIRGVSQVAFFKDAGGILRYNKAFQQARCELLSAQRLRLPSEGGGSQRLRLPSEGGGSRRPPGSLADLAHGSPPRSVMRAMRNTFKHIIYQFRKKDDVLSDSPSSMRSLNPAVVPARAEADKEPVPVPTSGIPESTIDAVEMATERQPATSNTEATTDKQEEANDGAEVEAKTDSEVEAKSDTEPDTTVDDEPVASTSDAEATCAAEASSSAPADPQPLSSGRSMVTVPVSLRLGHHNERTRYGLARVPGELECLEQYDGDSFTGGSCLKVNPSDRLTPEHRYTRLFHCDFACNHTLFACVVTKNLIGYEEQSLNVKLFLETAEGAQLSFVLVGRDVPPAGRGGGGGLRRAACALYPVNYEHSHKFVQLRKYLLLNEPAFYVPVENHFNWHVRYYIVRVPDARVTSVVCRTAVAHGPILLGHFGLCNVRTDDTVIK